MFLNIGAGAYGASGGGDCAAKTRLAGHLQHHERLRPARAPPAVASPLLLSLCVCMHACMSVCMHACVHVYIHYMHTHRQTHTQVASAQAGDKLAVAAPGSRHCRYASSAPQTTAWCATSGCQILNAFAEMGNMSLQCIHKHAHTHTHRRTHAHKHIHIHTYIHTYIHTSIQTFTHTYKHSYIHT